MIDFTPTQSRQYSAMIDREHQVAQDTLRRTIELTNEMAGVLLRGDGTVRCLNVAGKPAEWTAEDCFECYSEPAKVLALLRELERTPAVPMGLRIRIGAMFATMAREFAEIAAENAQ